MRRQPVSYSEELAQLMRELTQKKSYRQIARDAETSPSTIGNMVLGRIPSEDVCIRVAKAADTEPDTLLLACGYEPIKLTDLADQTVSKLRMFAGSKRPTPEEITEAEKKIIAEFNRLKSEK